MSKETNIQPPFDELPPTSEQHISGMNEAQASKQVEHGYGSSVQGSTSASSGSQTTAQQPVVDQTAQHAGAQVVANASSVATPAIADDEDLIEKEWVLSAKRIVEQTKGDPHARSENLSTVKKDYKKKRFNIDDDLGAEE